MARPPALFISAAFNPAPNIDISVQNEFEDVWQ
jgi:hypothetical protein